MSDSDEEELGGRRVSPLRGEGYGDYGVALAGEGIWVVVAYWPAQACAVSKPDCAAELPSPRNFPPPRFFDGHPFDFYDQINAHAPDVG